MAHITDQKHLQGFVEGVNIWAKVMKTKTYDIKNLSGEDKAELTEQVEMSLSPENLTCDGELTGNTLKLKTAQLKGAQARLKELSK